MGMYNMVFSPNMLGPTILAALGLELQDVGRYRDCYVAMDEICVYTRNGGGNRGAYKEVFEKLKQHPQYLRDQDDDYDSTYATIYFSFPEQYKDLLTKLNINEPWDPDKRWKTVLGKLGPTEKAEQA